jgi:hypothetical protein
MESSAGCLGAGFAKSVVGIVGVGFARWGSAAAAGWPRMGLGYGVVEAVVEAIVGTTLVETSGGAAVHDLVNCIGVVGVVKPLSCAVLFVRIGRGHSNSFDLARVSAWTVCCLRSLLTALTNRG